MHEQSHRVARALVAAAAVCGVLAVLVHQLAARRAAVPDVGWSAMVVSLTWPAAGLLLLRSDGRNACGWVLVASGLVGPYQLVGEYSLWNHYVHPLPASDLTDWVGSFGFVVYLVVVPLVPLLYPDGRLPSPLWRPVVRVLVATTVLVMLARMLVPGGTDVDAAIDNPAGVPGLEWLNWVVAAGATVTNVGGLGAAAVALSVRARRAVGAERRQLQWFFVAGLLMLASLVLTVLTRQDVFFDLALLGPPLGVVAGRLLGARVDVDTVLRRGVVLVVVLVVVGAGGTAVLLRLDPALTSTRAGVLVVGGLAVGAALLRNTVQRLLDRWWYPHRQEAATLEARVVGSTGLSADPLEALAELVAGVRGALRLPYVAFRGAKDVRDGVPTATVVQLDALALGEARGVLEASPRGDRGLRREERLVLERVAGQAGLLAHAAALAEQVGRSRVELVAAREEERRRLRNDLHDGVGPSLAAVALQADALGSRIVGPARDAAWALRDDLRRAVGEVRVVSHGLRPPVLDQIGLRAALEQLVARSHASQVRLELGTLRVVGAAVEVAVLTLVEAAVERADADDANELAVRVGHRGPAGGAGLSIEVRHGPDPSDRPLDPTVHDAVVAVGGALTDAAGHVVVDLPGGTTAPLPTAVDERISP